MKFYQTERGELPVKEFISQLETPTRSKIDSYFNLLASQGPWLKPPYAKKLQSGLYELRISGKETVRILYTMVNNEYYLLHVFKKQSQKTPQKELKTAIDRTKDLI